MEKVMLSIYGKNFPVKGKSRYKSEAHSWQREKKQVRLLEEQGGADEGGRIRGEQSAEGRAMTTMMMMMMTTITMTTTTMQARCARLSNNAVGTWVDAFAVSFAADFPCYFCIVLNWCECYSVRNVFIRPIKWTFNSEILVSRAVLFSHHRVHALKIHFLYKVIIFKTPWDSWFYKPIFKYVLLILFFFSLEFYLYVEWYISCLYSGPLFWSCIPFA